MGSYKSALGKQIYTFQSLRELMAKASPLRSGDVLAGVAAKSETERIAAQLCLANVHLKDFLQEELVPYSTDEVTRLIIDSHNSVAFAPVSSMTVGSFREWLLNYETTAEKLTQIATGLTPEMVAAVCKICRNQDLILIAKKCRVVTKFRNTIGLEGRVSVRLQPNHPTDNPEAISVSILDGLLYGCGDAVIGINPATDSAKSVNYLLQLIDAIIQKFEIPTQSCILGHVTTQLKAMEMGAPIDLVFQSVAGTQATNTSFGINLELLRQAREAALSLGRGTLGNNVMYFETGQGSCLSANGHHGLDQQTLEARAYAVAREFSPLLVNTVVGFIGPEYLQDGKQIIRAGLEDHFCGKLLGLPMGCDVCYTNHSLADQEDMDVLLTLLGVAGCSFFMGVPGADDIMLNYQSTSFHDAQYLRQVLGSKPAPEFATWLEKMQVMDVNRAQLKTINRAHKLLLAAPCESDSGAILPQKEIIVSDQSPNVKKDPWNSLRAFTPARIALGRAGGSLPTHEMLDFRGEHALARDAVFEDFKAQEVMNSLQKLGLKCVCVQSQAADRLKYLERPDFGRSLAPESKNILQTTASLNKQGVNSVCIVVSDGLSAAAVNKNVVPLVALLAQKIENSDLQLLHVVVAEFGRVALQDEIGEILGADISVILLGERPGLGSYDSIGAYITYKPRVGRTDAERNCVSNIRETGLSLQAASDKIFSLLHTALMLQESGVGVKEDTLCVL